MGAFRGAIIAVAIFGLALAIYLLVGPSDTPGPVPTADRSAPHTMQPGAGSVGAEAASAEKVRPDDVHGASDIAISCVDLEINFDHPWVAGEMLRLAAVSTSGPAMTAYRGLNETDLRSLAEQGDSGAMVVLAKRARLRSEGEPPENAVAELAGEETSAIVLVEGDKLDEETAEHLREAEYWYYQAALHGRIAALTDAGTIRGQLANGPTGLGWVSDERWQSMGDDERQAFFPLLVYQEAALRLLERSRYSPMTELVLEAFGQKRPARVDEEAVAAIVARFRQDVEEAGLRVPSVRPYAGPDADAWRREFCETAD